MTPFCGVTRLVALHATCRRPLLDALHRRAVSRIVSSHGAAARSRVCNTCLKRSQQPPNRLFELPSRSAGGAESGKRLFLVSAQSEFISLGLPVACTLGRRHLLIRGQRKVGLDPYGASRFIAVHEYHRFSTESVIE